MNIQTFSLSGVQLSGCHGATAIEQHSLQPFSVDVSFSFDAARAIKTESLVETIDYYAVLSALQQTIERAPVPCVLLESLIHQTAHELEKKFPIISLDLSIQKTRTTFRPACSLRRQYFSERTALGMRSFEELHGDLLHVGMTATPFLSEEELRALRQRSEQAEYVRQPEIAKSGIVREDLSSCAINHESDPCMAIADRVAVFLCEMERALGVALIEHPLTHKEITLQKYEKGSFGITPHRDEKICHNLVCIIPLKGKGTLAVCDDREGNNPMAVDTTPGNLILLRAPGYMGMSVRPMHVVSNITEERIVMGIRFPRTET